MSFFGKIAEWFHHIIEGDDCYTVTVKKGDSLWKIAEALMPPGQGGATHILEEVKRIAAANPEKNWDENYVIYPGEVLKIPKD